MNVTGAAMVELGAGAGRNVFGNAFGRERGTQEHARWRANDGAFEGGRGRGCGCGGAGRSVEHIISSISNTQSNALRARDTTHHKSRQKRTSNGYLLEKHFEHT